MLSHGFKTSLAPGSGVVKKYLDKSGLQPYLNQLDFHIVGYGCTTCIGNSGDLDEAVSAAISENDIVAAAVLSGNRNFEGCVHPLTRVNYLASPLLVAAYALAGTFNENMDIFCSVDGTVFNKEHCNLGGPDARGGNRGEKEEGIIRDEEVISRATQHGIGSSEESMAMRKLDANQDGVSFFEEAHPFRHRGSTEQIPII